jgi:hypothetical protein
VNILSIRAIEMPPKSKGKKTKDTSSVFKEVPDFNVLVKGLVGPRMAPFWLAECEDGYVNFCALGELVSAQDIRPVSRGGHIDRAKANFERYGGWNPIHSIVVFEQRVGDLYAVWKHADGSHRLTAAREMIKAQTKDAAGKIIFPDSDIKIPVKVVRANTPLALVAAWQ